MAATTASLTFYGGEKGGFGITQEGKNEDRAAGLDFEVSTDLFKIWTEIEIFTQRSQKSLAVSQFESLFGVDLAGLVYSPNGDFRGAGKTLVLAKCAENSQSREELLSVRLGHLAGNERSTWEQKSKADTNRSRGSRN